MTNERQAAKIYMDGLVRDFGSITVLDHSLYNHVELERQVVRLAEQYGWVLEPEVWLELMPLLRDDNPAWQTNESDCIETLGFFHDEAVDYLNEHVCPNGYVWEHDGYAGAFGCWKIEEAIE